MDASELMGLYLLILFFRFGSDMAQGSLKFEALRIPVKNVIVYKIQNESFFTIATDFRNFRTVSRGTRSN